MSNEVKDADLNLDLAFLPAWAQESPEINRYANYEGEREGRRAGGGRGPRRDRPPGDRPRGPRAPRDQRRDSDGPRGKRGKFSKGGHPPFEKRQELPPLDIDINVSPEAKGVDSLTRQIRITGRAYPLFDIARLILQKDDRFGIELRAKKPADGKPVQALFVSALDDTVWLTEDEAINHVLEKHFDTFYQTEKTPTDPPKGTYTFVAQCGMSGVILGPPNYHDYQTKLHKLHQERFANMPFERFRSRVKIVRDEEVVKKWIEEQSFKTEYVVLNVPEPLTLQSWNEVRDHFRSVHFPNIIKAVEQHLLPAANARRSGSRLLQRHVAHEIDQQRRFPLKMATGLSQQFASRGLQFFKVNKTIVHVSVARPHFLDIETEPVSDGVKKIVQFVNEHPRCTVKDLVEALAPAPAIEAQTPAAPAVADSSETTANTGEAATELGAQSKAPEHHQPTPQQNAVLADLHWLVHSGHVIEFASGELETAKKPLPKPQPAPKKKEKVEKAAEQPASASPTAGEATPGSETNTPANEAPTAESTPTASTDQPTEPPTSSNSEVHAVEAITTEVAKPAASEAPSITATNSIDTASSDQPVAAESPVQPEKKEPEASA